MMQSTMTSNIITSIEQQKNSDERFSVFIDGEFAFGISFFDMYNLGLKVGDVISEERMREIEEVTDTEKCKRYAELLVSRKMYTKKELCDKMKLKGFSATAISGTMSVLEEYGYINDRAYAEIFCREYSKKYGEHHIRYTLKQKGISAELIDEFCDGMDNRDTLTALIRKKLTSANPDRKEKDRIIRMFAAKGFSYDDIKSSLELLTEESDFFE